jgi:trans-aconitate 2-methyltransferase
MDWSAVQYRKFEAERTRPVRDLLAATATKDVSTAIDLGCGPGNSTELLQAKYPLATVSGIDNSIDMVAAARRRLPNVRFEHGDVAEWCGHEATGTFDVIQANAVLQWLPNHETLFPALMARLAPGGALAVQMPDNLDEPAHQLMRAVAAETPFAARYGDAIPSRDPLPGADWYHRRLRRAGAIVDIWRTTYYHLLAGGIDALVEWFMGSGLRPFLEPLDAAERSAFLSRYRSLLELAYPAGPDGSVLVAFPRLFIVARR